MVFDDLSPGYAAIVGVTEPLVALLVIALLARGIPRVLFIAQLVYWSLSYVARPILLLQVTPTPAFGDSIADTRLASTGYDYNIAHILPFVSDSLWIYAAMTAAFVLWQRTRSPGEMLPTQSANTITTLCVTWVITSLVRIYAYLIGALGKAGEVSSAHPYVQFFTDLGSLVAIGLILYFKSTNVRSTVLVFACAAAGELVWGIATESKTPFLGVILAFVIRLSAGRVSRARLVAIITLTITSIALFSSLQSVKESAAESLSTSNADHSYPMAVRPFLAIFRRFDLFGSATDAYFMDGRPYLSGSDVVARMVLNLIPQQLGVQKILPGPEWAARVRGSSLDMSGIQVSLAEGHFAEGYVVGGYAGVAAESLFVILMIALVGRCLSSRFLPSITIGVMFVSLPPLFEQGVLGITANLGKGLQMAIAMWIFGAIVGWLYRSNRKSDAHAKTDCGPPMSETIDGKRKEFL